MKKPIFFDYPETSFNLSFILDISAQEISSLLNQSLTVLPKKSEEDSQIINLLGKITTLSISEIRKIQKKLVFS